jgi:NAD(P)H dehydrogenase (quinone)
MHVHLVYAHPSRKSFTFSVLESFTAGLREAGHTYSISNLYEMDFQSDMDLDQYRRETSPDPILPVPADVAAEQMKIKDADALAFIYPVWWSDCPAKLKGWFDRVWTIGYAYSYGNSGHTAPGIGIKKALVICSAGHPVEHLEEIGIARSMRCVMLDDRLRGVGIQDAAMEILGGMITQDPVVREGNLRRAHELGRSFYVSDQRKVKNGMAQGKVHAINVSGGGVPKQSVPSALIRLTGVEGDRQSDLTHHSGADRAVTLFSLDLIRALQREGHPIVPGSIGENLTIDGVDWASLAPGVLVRVGQATLELTKPASPCQKIGPSFVDSAFVRVSEKVHPGWSRWCARVVGEGVVAVGDVVDVHAR